MQLPITDSAKVSQAAEELQSATEQVARYVHMFGSYSALVAQTRHVYHAQQLGLYRDLVRIMELRVAVAQFIISQLGANSPGSRGAIS